MEENNEVAVRGRPGSEENEDEISLLDLAAIVWKRRWMIVALTIVCAIGAFIYSLTIENTFTASATVLPISGEKSSSMAQYAGLAQMAGISIPGGSESSPTKKIEAILNSRSLAERIISELDLVPLLVKKPEKIKPPRTASGIALEGFKKTIFSVKTGEKSGLIVLSATTENPELSRDIANRTVQLLEDTLNAKAMTVSKKSRKLLESQIAEQETKVKGLQAQLTDFQRSTKMYSPEGQVGQVMELYSALIQQKISTEIELSRLESALSSDNPKIISLKTQLEAVERQIDTLQGNTRKGNSMSLSDTPEALVKYQNILQELEIATRIYGGLLASFENQKLQENEDQLFVEVIDPAVAPEVKAAPRRSMIAIVGTMAGFFMGVLLAFVLEAFGNILKDPEALAKFRKASGAKPQ